MVTRGNVPERNVGRLRIGNEATVRVDAIPDRAFTGRVARIAPVLDAATRSALIEIDILNSGGGLKAEMFARIELDLGMSRDAILIPRASLVYRGEQSGVYTVEGDRPTFVAIETGLTRDDQVEVLGNLDAGVKIVGRGATMLREGDRIRSGGAGAPGKSAKTDGTAPGKKKKSAANQPVAAGGGGGAVASNTP
jgi:RND family efflux transporter MFP subunit